jgi:hypothetical protein
LDKKIIDLNDLGDMWTYTYDVSKALTAVRDGEIDTTKSKIEIYRQAQQFLVVDGVSSSWAKHLKGKRAANCYNGCY